MNDVVNILSEKIDKSLAHTLVAEYIEIRKNSFHDDTIKTIIHAGRFSECALAAIVNLSDGTAPNLDSLKFEETYNNIQSKPKNSPQDVTLFTLIPYALRSVYTIRNKKRVAHMKDSLPDQIDASYVLSTSNWILAQLILVIRNMNTTKIHQLLEGLVQRIVPIVQEFGENDITIISSEFKTFSDKLLLVLYKYPTRQGYERLNILLRPQDKSYVKTYLSRLEKLRFVQLNEEGAVITKAGIEFIEEKINAIYIANEKKAQ